VLCCHAVLSCCAVMLSALLSPPPLQVIEEQHTFLDRQVSLLRCRLEPLSEEDKVRGGVTQ
jgi:hypothetical protein